MKIKQKNQRLMACALGAMIVMVARAMPAADPQALELIKLGDQYVGVQS